MTIQQEFQQLITDVFPQATSNGSGQKCSLTFRRKKEFENIYFAAYRTCFSRIMVASGKTEAEATEAMESICRDLDGYFSVKR